jgi:predicted transposase YbfD/YdcC
LGLKGAVFTLDALHCQKKTVKSIIDSGNDYVIAVKGNQPHLLQTIKGFVNRKPLLILIITKSILMGAK